MEGWYTLPMRPLILIIGLLLILFAFGSFYISGVIERNSNAALIISGIDTRKLEEHILSYYRTNITLDENSLREPSSYEIDMKYTRVNTDDKRDIIAVVRSDETCGSGGCIMTIFLQNEVKEFEPIDFRYAVGSIAVEDTITRGMHDLMVNGSRDTKLIWNDHSYVLE